MVCVIPQTARGVSKSILFLAASACFCAAALSAGDGRFVGKVVVEWLDQEGSDRKMKLLEDFGFEEATGKVWLVPKGHIIDGASIPPAFQSLIGAPFVGKYRKASVIHDYYCYTKSEQWKDVHRMFYFASIRSGINETQAKIMYMAVYAQGPRWEIQGSSCYRGCHAAAASLTWRPVVAETDLRPVVDWIEQDNPGLEEIEQRLNAVMERPGPHLFAQGHRRTKQ